MIKKIKIPVKLEVSFCFLDSNNYIIVRSEKFQTSYFLMVPFSLNITKRDAYFIIESTNLKDLYFFQKKLLMFLKKFINLYKKTIILKGLGLKVTQVDDILELKLGYSHIIKIKVPSSIFNVIINKNIITVEGFNNIEIGNFLTKVRQLRLPNIYKGKGIWYKNEIINLKNIKKT